MTILGDLAQSTTPAGQQDWNVALGHVRAPTAEVSVLTIGYRVPGPILDAANRLLPYTQVASAPSRSVRVEGSTPVVRIAAGERLPEAVAAEVAVVRHRHHNTGVVAPAALHDAIGSAFAAHGLALVRHVHELGHDDVPVFTAEEVKGLEFDGVVVVNAHQIYDGSALGARLLYVAMTRAVQVLHLVADAPPPPELELSGGEH
jgi:DNA helicase IV